MNKIISLIIFLLSFGIVHGQSTTSCTDILSQAEEAYRNGRFGQVKIIASCLGAFKSRSGQNIVPPRMAKLVRKLNSSDSLYRSELGDFLGFGHLLEENAQYRNAAKNVTEKWGQNKSDEEIKKEIKARRKEGDLSPQILSRAERRRAYILLGQTYGELDVQPLSIFLAQRLIKEHPIDLLDKDEANLSFQRLYTRELERVMEISVGPLLGIYFPLPINKIVNRENPGKYPFNWGFNLGIGFQVNLHLKENLSIGTGMMELTQFVNYEERETPGAPRLDFLHLEESSWFKFPLWLKWAPSKKIRPQVLFDPKFFLQSGISLNLLTKSKVWVTIPATDFNLNSFRQTDGRNRFNADILLGGGVRFKFARGYFSFSFNLAYPLDHLADQEKVGTNASPIYREHQILENNYQLFTGFWSFTYLHRFNLFKKAR